LIDNDGLKVVARLLAERPDLTDEELAYFCEQETKIRVSRPTMGRAVRRIGFTRKKGQRCRPSVTDRA